MKKLSYIYFFSVIIGALFVLLIPAPSLASITLNSPVGGEQWQVGSDVLIRWSCSGINEVKIYLQDALAGVRRDIVVDPARCPNSFYIWTIPTDIPPGSQYTVTITKYPIVAPYSSDSNITYITISGGTDGPGGPGGDPGGPGGPGGFGSGLTTIENPLKYDTFQGVLGAVSKFLFQIGLALAPVMLIIAGFMFVTAGGSPDRVSNARKMALYTIIGLAVILLASGLIAVLKSIIGYTG